MKPSGRRMCLARYDRMRRLLHHLLHDAIQARDEALRVKIARVMAHVERNQAALKETTT